MKFKLSALPKVEIAKGIKVPYAANSLNVAESDCNPYKDTHGDLYYVKSSRFITHFYSKNNLIFYKRNKRMSFFEFVPNFIKGSYRFIEFKNIQGRIMEEGKMVLRTPNGNWLLVAQKVELQDNRRYIIAIDFLNNKTLLSVSKDNEIYSRFLPVISNNIMPIIQFQKDGIFIYLIDLSNETVHLVKWGLTDIKQLILDTLRICKVPSEIILKVNEDSINCIHDIRLERIDGYPEHDIINKQAIHIRALKILFSNITMIGEKYDYALNKFGINIELSENTISVYWNYRFFYTHDGLYIMKKKVIDKFPKSEDDMVFYINENLSKLLESDIKLLEYNINVNTRSGDIYYVNEIYRDDFHYVTQDHNGVKVVNCGSPQDFYLNYYTVSVYRYKRYIFMFKHGSTTKLEIIDVYNNLLLSLDVDAEIKNSTERRILYHFYPLENLNKLLFLHVQLNFLLILDLRELERVFNDLYSKKGELECEKHLIRKAEDFLKIFRLHDLINHAMCEHIPCDGVIYDIRIISHYLDKQSNILYFLVKCMQDNNKITALFFWDVSNRDVRLGVVQYSIGDSANAALKVTGGTKRHKNKPFRISNKIDLYNIDVHKSEHRFRKLVDLDILFNSHNCFVSVRNNRVSLPILGIDGNRAGFKIENIRDFVFLSFCYHGMRDDNDLELDIDFSSCFILSELSLVSQIPAIEF